MRNQWGKILSLIGIAGFILTTISCFAGKAEIEKKLNIGYFRGYASLSLKEAQIEIGKKFSVDIRFTNKSGGAYFYNPFFNRLIPLSAKLAIYNSKKEYIGNLLYWEGGSRKNVASNDWKFIPADSYVGTPLTFTAGYVPDTAHGVTSNLLPLGEYYLQMIYYKSFVSSNPDRLISNPPKDKKTMIREFYKNFNREELFSSNVVKIVFVKKKITSNRVN